MIEVVQAFDRSPIAELPSDDAAALERKLSTAQHLFKDRPNWLKPYRRIEILHRLAALVQDKRADFGRLIAREGGKPLTDALIETDRAIDGIRYAANELRTWAGREIPMGLTAASVNRRAWTVPEPIGVVAAISAFNHPLNLIVHQIAPAIASGCPVIVKPATATPLNCVELVKLVHEAGLPDGWVQTYTSCLIPAGRAARGSSFSADSLMIKAAVASQGLALVRDIYAEEAIGSGLVRIPIAASLGTPLSYYFVTLTQDAQKPRIRAFRNWLLGEIASRPALVQFETTYRWPETATSVEV